MARVLIAQAAVGAAAILTAYGLVISFDGGWRLDNPRRRWAIRAFALSLLICIGVLCAGCSVKPIHCTGSEDCPAVERCEAGRCTETKR